MDLKTNEELANMSVDELAGYYNTLNEEKQSAIQEAINSKSSKEEVAKLHNEYKKDVNEQMDKLNSILIEQGLKIKKMSEKKSTDVVVYGSSLKKGLTDNIENLKGLKQTMAGAKNHEFKIEIPTNHKAAGDMAYSASPASAPLGQIPVPFREPGVYDERRSTLGFLPYVETTAVSSNTITWVKKQNRENGASGVAEAESKPQSDFELVVEEATVFKYANYIKVSTEMLDDINFLQGEINRELIGNVLEDVDKDCFTGSGSYIRGLKNKGIAYSAGSYAGDVTNPNLIDVLVTAMAQMAKNYYKASRIFVNPEDVASLKLVKDTTGQYVARALNQGEAMSIDGVPITESYHVPAGEFFVCDMSQIRMYVRSDMGLEFGMSGDDMIKNLRTILTEWRGVLRIVDNKAIIKGDIASAEKELGTA